MSDPRKKPHVPRELLEVLRKRFPDRAPDRDTDVKDVWIQVGNVEVVRYLQQLFNQQETT